VKNLKKPVFNELSLIRIWVPWYCLHKKHFSRH